MITEEIWRDIKGYKGIYLISNYGDIRSIGRYISDTIGRNRYWKSRMLKKSLANSGYYRVNLYKNKKIEQFLTHRLVAIHFIDKINGKPYVNHKDGNKLNNCVDNLEWCTQPENIRHAHEIGLINNVGINHPNSKLTTNQVIQIKKMLGEGFMHKEIAPIYNVSISCIQGISAGYNWKHI